MFTSQGSAEDNQRCITEGDKRGREERDREKGKGGRKSKCAKDESWMEEGQDGGHGMEEYNIKW